jgi:hypothetical protein
MEYLPCPEENTISIFVPMMIKKRGGGHATVILPKNAAHQSDKPNYDAKMINAFAKAYKWQQTMLKNSRLTINALAEKENLTPAYVGRILRLNLIAPDIIKAILDGRQPRDLKLQDFMTKTISDLWCEQKEMFGFNF